MEPLPATKLPATWQVKELYLDLVQSQATLALIDGRDQHQEEALVEVENAIFILRRDYREI